MNDAREKAKRSVALNRKARHDYEIEDTFEAGMVLTGTEVKSLRQGRASIQDAFARAQQGEIWLFNAFIPEYTQGNRHNHQPTRPRKLLLHGRQVRKLIGYLKNKGVTLIPLSIYFNKSGFAKVELAVAHGRKAYEKREAIKQRDWKREASRIMRDRG